MNKWNEREGHEGLKAEGMKASSRGSVNSLYLRLPQLDIDDRLPQDASMLKRISSFSVGKRP